MPRTVHVKRNFLYAFCAGFLCLCVIFRPVAKASTEPLQGKEISISVRKSSLSNILNQVSKKSGITIYFVDTDLAPYTNIDYDAKDKDVTSILAELFKGKDLLYEVISEKQIGVRKKVKATISEEYRDTLLTVSGTVTNEKGEPLPGATIKVKNKNIGATADNKGNFVIKNISSTAVLTISNVAHSSLDIPISGRSFIGRISLKELIGTIDEAVVIAYGTTTRRYSTGNITSIKGTDIEKQPINNPLLALQGRVPGLLVTQSSGLSGSGVTVRIQGINSIGNGNDPFYVIDGVPYLSQLLPSTGRILGNSGTPAVNGAALYGNPLSYLNPNDIESIEILKDADATSIYGSRAANGAILITTKRGKMGRSKIDFTFNSGFSHVPRKLKMLSTDDYIRLRREAKINDNLPINSTDYDINGFWDTTRTTDWQKELIGNMAKFNDAEVSSSGGNENTNFRLSIGYHNETVVFPGDFDDNRISGHFNINHSSENKKLNIQYTASFLSDINKLPLADLTSQAITLAPDAPQLYNSDGTVNWAVTNTGRSSWINPISSINKLYENNTKNLIANTLLSYEILKGVQFKSSFGYNFLLSDEITQERSVSIRPENRAILPRAGTYTHNKTNAWIIEPQLQINRRVGNGRLDALLGMTFQDNNSNGQILTGIGYTSDQLISDIKSANEVTVRNTTVSSYKYSAIFLRLNYIIDESFIVNLSGRRDGSSRFGDRNKFSNFGSVGAAWIFSDLEQIKDAFHWLNFGKIKASYGTTGNDQIGDYRYLNLYQSDGAVTPYQGINTLSPTGLSNEYIEWERVKKLQFGIDLSLFKDRLSLTATYYNNRSNNQLLSFSLPSFVGFRTVDGNFPALVENSGIELSLGTQNIVRNKFGWSTNFNITIPHNKLLEFDNLSSSFFSGNYIVGKPITIQQSFIFRGVDPSTGIYVFEDSKGGITTNPNPETDRLIIQNTMPSFFGGLQNTFTFGNLQLDMIFQFVKQIGSNVGFGFSIPGQFNKNQPEFINDRWRVTGDNKSIQKASSNTSLNGSFGNASASNAAFTDASFVRLKTASLSWLMPRSWLSKARMKDCSLFLRGQNLLTITRYKGLDPETRSSTVLPPLRVITFGVKLSL